MILGYADALVQDEGAAEEARASARVIRAQGLKIKDLVTDLNTASQLDYDMQPMRLERVHAARLLRTVAAAHANSGLDEAHPIDLAALEARLARSRTARSAAGSFNRDHGLGLVLVDRIARAHEGSLSLDGAPGEGFSVTLALPLA